MSRILARLSICNNPVICNSPVVINLVERLYKKPWNNYGIKSKSFDNDYFYLKMFHQINFHQFFKLKTSKNFETKLGAINPKLPSKSCYYYTNYMLVLVYQLVCVFCCYNLLILRSTWHFVIQILEYFWLNSIIVFDDDVQDSCFGTFIFEFYFEVIGNKEFGKKCFEKM